MRVIVSVLLLTICSSAKSQYIEYTLKVQDFKGKYHLIDIFHLHDEDLIYFDNLFKMVCVLDDKKVLFYIDPSSLKEEIDTLNNSMMLFIRFKVYSKNESITSDWYINYVLKSENPSLKGMIGRSIDEVMFLVHDIVKISDGNDVTRDWIKSLDDSIK